MANGNTKTTSKREEKSREFQVLELGGLGCLDSRMLKELANKPYTWLCHPNQLALSAVSYVRPQQRSCCFARQLDHFPGACWLPYGNTWLLIGDGSPSSRVAAQTSTCKTRQGSYSSSLKSLSGRGRSWNLCMNRYR